MSLSPKWLQVHKDADGDLDAADHRDKALVKDFETELEASLVDGGRWLPVDGNSALDRVVLPTPTAINKA